MAIFDVEVHEKLVKVESPRSKSRFSGSTMFTVLLCSASGVYTFTKVLPAFPHLFSVRRFDAWSWLLELSVLYLALALCWTAFRALFRSGQSLTCDGDLMTIGHIPAYVLTGRWVFESFPVNEVKQLKFMTVRVSTAGGTNALTFESDGKKKTALQGLEAPEADEILTGLAKLGVNTVHDPGMSMIVEMALERRKSRFGIF